MASKREERTVYADFVDTCNDPVFVSSHHRNSSELVIATALDAIFLNADLATELRDALTAWLADRAAATGEVTT